MKKKLIVFILLITGISGFVSFSQDANSFYFMRGVPQTYQVNPAIQPEYNFFVGLPGLAPFKFNLKTPIGVSDILKPDPNSDSTFFFNNPVFGDEGPQEFLDAMKDFNSFSTEFSVSLASIGFRTSENGYTTFDIRERAMINVGYSRDFFRLPLFGLGEDDVFDLEMDLGINVFSEFSMGVSRKIGDRLTVGWRGKLLFGQANLHTPEFKLNLATGSEQYTVNTDAQIRASAPYLLDYVTTGVNIPFKTALGDFDNIDIQNPSTSEIINMALNTSNFGLAMDVGIDLRLFDWLQLSASVIDFGSIKWDSMVSVEQKVNYTTEGVEFNSLEDDYDPLEPFLDSLETTMDNASVMAGKYRAFLPTKVYIGAAVYPHPKVSFGILSRTDIYHGRLSQQFSVSANLYPIRMFSTSLSYSLIQGKYSSYGVGVALKLLPFNFYLLTDFGPSLTRYRIPTSETDYLPVDLPIDFRNINLKVGMNIMLGGPKRAQKKKAPVYDLPLID